MHDDSYEPKSETSTSCPSDDDHEDIVIAGIVDVYHYDSVQAEKLMQPIRPANHKLKNELCRNYLTIGYCPYNEKCQFAHGTCELRQNSDYNGKYKTKKCSAFFHEGHCVYGERCNFLHSEPQKPQ
jgi:hypothetical protein